MPIKQQLLTLALLIAFLLPLTACQPIQPLPAMTPGAMLPGSAPPAAPDVASEILWDTWGVPHILAQEPASASYALGWARSRVLW